MDPLTHDPIESLLRSADDACGAPEMPADLADRVRRRARRRRARRMGFAAAAAAACLGASTFAVFEVRRRAADADAARIRTEIGRLEREAESLASIVRRMESIEIRRRAAEELRRIGVTAAPAARIEDGIEEAAAVLVGHADHVLRRGGSFEDAAHAYRRVIAHFGDTRWADVARKRLRESEKL